MLDGSNRKLFQQVAIDLFEEWSKEDILNGVALLNGTDPRPIYFSKWLYNYSLQCREWMVMESGSLVPLYVHYQKEISHRNRDMYENV